MKEKQVVVNLPVGVYEELQRIADASSWSFDEVLLQTIRMGMPPTLNKVPTNFRDELLDLNQLDDRDLMRVVEGELLYDGPQDEQHKKANFEVLRRTYALSLLKWRGHPLPPPYETMIE